MFFLTMFITELWLGLVLYGSCFINETPVQGLQILATGYMKRLGEKFQIVFSWPPDKILLSAENKIHTKTINALV